MDSGYVLQKAFIIIPNVWEIFLLQSKEGDCILWESVCQWNKKKCPHSFCKILAQSLGVILNQLLAMTYFLRRVDLHCSAAVKFNCLKVDWESQLNFVREFYKKSGDVLFLFHWHADFRKTICLDCYKKKTFKRLVL